MLRKLKFRLIRQRAKNQRPTKKKKGSLTARSRFDPIFTPNPLEIERFIQVTTHRPLVNRLRKLARNSHVRIGFSGSLHESFTFSIYVKGTSNNPQGLGSFDIHFYSDGHILTAVSLPLEMEETIERLQDAHRIKEGTLPTNLTARAILRVVQPATSEFHTPKQSFRFTNSKDIPRAWNAAIKHTLELVEPILATSNPAQSFLDYLRRMQKRAGVTKIQA